MEDKRREVRIYPWSFSVTREWGPDTGIYLLRDEDPVTLARILFENGRYVIGTGLYEIIAHGNPRRAAEVARELTKIDPGLETEFTRLFGEEGTKTLLKRALAEIPSAPSEYPANVRIMYVN